MSNSSVDDRYVTDWCSRPDNYKTIVEWPESTAEPLKPKDQPKTDPAAKDGSGRRLGSFEDMQEIVFEEVQSRFLQATATTKADLEAEAAEDALDAQRKNVGSDEKMYGVL